MTPSDLDALERLAQKAHEKYAGWPRLGDMLLCRDCFGRGLSESGDWCKACSGNGYALWAHPSPGKILELVALARKGLEAK